MIHCSCDNIDVLEATLDGKNTFHCTEMMVWQTGPPPEQREDTASGKGPGGKSLLRSRAIRPGAVHEFQRLDQATLASGQKPSPSFSGQKKIEMEWFSKAQDDEKEKAHAKDLAGVVSRMHDGEDDPPIPAWGALNEAISVSDPPVTTAGMLPILQAPADDNDTLTTVIHRFMDISSHVGQKHTIITADQPLYIRGKELVWANSKYENVIFHICFNFLKAIGQHMESAGLDDLWTEAVVEHFMKGCHVTRHVQGLWNGISSGYDD